MKLTFLTLASTAALAIAAPATTIEKRADFCGQWDNQVSGPYTISTESLGQGRCHLWLTMHGRGRTQREYTEMAHQVVLGWRGKVKSYANVVTKINQVALSAIKSLPSTWSWSYTGSNMVANVAYDLFTSSSATGSAQYEIMIWLSALGGAGPISSTGSPISTVTLAGTSWKLYNGKNGQMNVFSFVANSEVKNFKGDLMEFVNHLTSQHGMPKSQILQSVGAGTEPFSGSNAVLTTSAYSMSQS